MDAIIYGILFQSKVRGSFPVERIKIVNDTDLKTFRKGTVTKPELCFQVGPGSIKFYIYDI